MLDVSALSAGQYSLVYNMFSLTIAAFGAAFVFFILAQPRVAPKYRISLIVSALVVGIACYHYFRIMHSWEAAYLTGAEFNDAYRYVDWLLTVPLLLVELVLVMALAKSESRPLLTKLVIAATAMIALGYPGEVAADNMTRAIWGTLSTIPFAYILYVLWGELGQKIRSQTGEVATLLSNTRLILLATWGFYPIAYMAPFFGWEGSTALVTVQVGYTIADITAKAGFGLMIYAIARAKTEAEEAVAQKATQYAAA
jgi:bacteriorhodopsin